MQNANAESEHDMRDFAAMHNDYLDPDLHDGPATTQRTLYKVQWHNDHASGVFDEEFTSRRKAEEWAREWKRGMVAMEATPQERAEARREYQWEII